MNDSNQRLEHLIDACGLRCPEPVMLLHKAMRKATTGDQITMRATDPSTQRDVPNFCRFLGHELVSQKSDNDVFIYEIKKCR